MVRLVTVCSMICFLEIKRYQSFIVLKGATYVVFVFRSLLHWCFYVLVLYSKQAPVWLSVWFLPIKQVSFVSIQAPAIRYAYRLHSRYDFSIFRLIVTPLICNAYLPSKVFCGIHLKAISQEVLKNLIHNVSLEITLLKFLHISQGPMS